MKASWCGYLLSLLLGDNCLDCVGVAGAVHRRGKKSIGTLLWQWRVGKERPVPAFIAQGRISKGSSSGPEKRSSWKAGRWSSRRFKGKENSGVSLSFLIRMTGGIWGPLIQL